jgi:dienelactone hydrolase
MTVELVTTTTKDGVRLDGTLLRPLGEAVLGFDAVILHHGYAGNFYVAGNIYGPSFEGELQERFARAGVAAFRVNSRGHDLAYNSPKGRLGGLYERLEDCVLDWQAWLECADAMGYRRIVPWGQSLGAVKNIYYMAVARDERVPCAIATSPPRLSYSAALQRDVTARLTEQLHQAQRLVEAGQGDALVDMTVPPMFRMTSAQTYLDKWGPEERFNVLARLRDAMAPVLVTVGSEEGKGPEAPDWLQFGGLAEELAKIAATTPNVSFELVEGANHAYAGCVDALWSLARDWLRRPSSHPQ